MGRLGAGTVAQLTPRRENAARKGRHAAGESARVGRALPGLRGTPRGARHCPTFQTNTRAFADEYKSPDTSTHGRSRVQAGDGGQLRY